MFFDIFKIKRHFTLTYLTTEQKKQQTLIMTAKVKTVTSRHATFTEVTALVSEILHKTTQQQQLLPYFHLFLLLD